VPFGPSPQYPAKLDKLARSRALLKPATGPIGPAKGNDGKEKSRPLEGAAGPTVGVGEVVLGEARL
jgi:hypothetical protein